MSAMTDQLFSRHPTETKAVQELAERSGYGFVMQIASELWKDKDATSAISTGPCFGFLVRCPHPGSDGDVYCDWCCGSGYVTERVMQAIKQAK